MPIYLVQHGKAIPKDVDPERGLSEEGRIDSERIAGVAAGYGIRPSSIIHSGKNRSLQTAEIFADILKPPGAIVKTEGMGPKDNVATFAAGLDSNSMIMYVGHLPFMEKLTAFLITGYAESPVIRFQNSCIVCLDTLPDSGMWVIKWSLMPDID